MMNYNKRNITIFSILLTLIVFLFVHFILYFNKNNPKKEVNSTLILKTGQYYPNLTSIKTEEKKQAVEEITLNQYQDNNWRIIISKIHLDAPILEGTSKEVLRRGVGHFEESQQWNGNVCLAAHNRGYKYNYFQELKKLEIGDHIVYQTTQGKRTYSVIQKTTIKETDWSYVQDTKENYLTLFTCAENMPEYRLCIQAKQII